MLRWLKERLNRGRIEYLRFRERTEINKTVSRLARSGLHREIKESLLATYFGIGALFGFIAALVTVYQIGYYFLADAHGNSDIFYGLLLTVLLSLIAAPLVGIISAFLWGIAILLAVLWAVSNFWPDSLVWLAIVAAVTTMIYATNLSDKKSILRKVAELKAKDKVEAKKWDDFFSVSRQSDP